MSCINKVCVSGNLGHDPELKTTQGGTSVCSFSVCVNDRKKEGDSWVDVPNWIDVIFFGNRAESLKQYLHKGSLVFVSGKLRQNRWEDKDGNKRSKIEIIGDEIQFGSTSQQSQQPQYQPMPQYQQGYQPQYQPQQYQPQYQPQYPQGYQQPYQPQYQQPTQPQIQEEGVYDEDIPF